MESERLLAQQILAVWKLLGSMKKNRSFHLKGSHEQFISSDHGLGILFK